MEAADPADPALRLLFTRTARDVERAFDHALAGSGGSRSTWLILATLTSGGRRSQRELADAIGLGGATLTHHLNAMEADGLLRRRRDRADRRNHLVELTEHGRARFTRLREIAVDFDETLSADIPPAALAGLTQILAAMRANLTAALTVRLEQRPRAPAPAP